MYGYNSKEDILQNLRDAGCDCETIACFMECLSCENTKDELTLLQKHRACLLENLHREQACIDCLDYLIYQIKKQSREKEQKS